MAFGASVQELLVRLKYEATGQQSIEQSANSLSRVEQHAGLATTRLTGLKGVTAGVGGAMQHAAGQIGGLVSNMGFLAGGAGLLGLGAALTSSVDKIENFGAALEKVQTLTGETAVQAGALILEFQKFGLGADKITQVVGFTEKTLGKLNQTTAAGVNKLAELDKTYGLQLLDTNGKVVDFSTALSQLATFYDTSASASTKAYVASQIFGRGYTTMIPILNEGAAGLRQAAADAASLGLNSEATTKQIIAFHDEAHLLDNQVNLLQLSIGTALLPTLIDTAKSLTSFISDNRTGIVSAFKSGVSAAQDLAGALGQIFSVLKAGWDAVPGPLRNLLITGFVANKASSWLFGGSLLQGSRGLLSTLIGSTPLARVPGVGALAGAGVPHVWVDNMPLGGIGGLGAGAGGATGAAEALGGLAAPGLGVAGAGVLGILAAYLLPQTLLRQSAPRPTLTTTTPAGTINAAGIGGTDYFSGLMPGFTQMALQAGATAGAATSVRAYGEHAADRIVAANNRANAIIGAGLTQGHRDMDKLNGTLITVIGGKLDHLTEAQKSANLKLFGESHKITGKVPSEGDWLRAQLAAASSHANPERARLESQLATAQKELTAALKAIKPSRGAEGLQWFGGAATGDAARIAELRKTIADLTAQLKKTTDIPGRKLTQADLTVADAMTKALTQNLQHVESAVKDKKDLVSGLANIATLQRAARIAQSQGLTTLARGFSSDAQKLQAAVVAAQDTSRHVDSLKSHLDAITTAVQNIRFPAALVAAVNSGATSSSRERQVLGSLTVTTSERSNVIAHTRVGRWTPIRSSAI